MKPIPITTEAVPIGNTPFSWACDGDMVVYFNYFEPIDFHYADDTRAMYLRIARFRRIHGVRTIDLTEAFQLSRDTIARILRHWDEDGTAWFYKTDNQ